MQATAIPVGTVSDPSVDATIFSDARQKAFKKSVDLARNVIAKATDAADGNGNAFAKFDISDLVIPDFLSLTDLSSVQDRISKQVENFSNGYMSLIVSAATGANGNGTTSICGYSGRIGGSISRMKCVGDYLVLGHMSLSITDAAIKTGLSATEATVSLGQALPGGDAPKGVYMAFKDWMKEVALNLLTGINEKLSHAAFMFSVVLPSMPYILFLIVVAGWVLGVLQTVMVVPLWALLHMTPERTFVGSQSQGYLLLLSLFVRPSLALIGLYMGILVSDPIINFVVSSFFAIRSMVDGANLWPCFQHLVYLGTFMWWLIVLSYVLLAVLYMCFALPQMLPGTVLSWIGGGISDPGESHAVQNVRSQMAGAPRSGVFNPFRRQSNALKRPGAPTQAAKLDNPNSRGNRTLQGGQGTAPRDESPI